MTPSGHCLLGASFCRSTNLPILMFLFSSIHLFLVGNVGRYSFVHLLQKCSKQIWMCFQRFLCVVAIGSLFRFANMLLLFNPSKKWFGVKASKSQIPLMCKIRQFLFDLALWMFLSIPLQHLWNLFYSLSVIALASVVGWWIVAVRW